MLEIIAFAQHIPDYKGQELSIILFKKNQKRLLGLSLKYKTIYS